MKFERSAASLHSQQATQQQERNAAGRLRAVQANLTVLNKGERKSDLNEILGGRANGEIHFQELGNSPLKLIGQEKRNKVYWTNHIFRLSEIKLALPAEFWALVLRI